MGTIGAHCFFCSIDWFCTSFWRSARNDQNIHDEEGLEGVKRYGFWWRLIYLMIPPLLLNKDHVVLIWTCKKWFQRENDNAFPRFGCIVGVVIWVSSEAWPTTQPWILDCAKAAMDANISRDMGTLLSKRWWGRMIRSYGFLEIKVKLDPERRRMADLTTHRR